MCDLQFVTHNLTAWKDVCLQHYVNKAEAGENTSFPSKCKISDGTQLNVQGHIVMNFYDTGVVMVQGKHLDTFEDIDFLLLKSAVSTWMNDANESINREKERGNLDNSKHSTATSISDVSDESSEASDHEHSMDTSANELNAIIPGSEQPAASKKKQSFKTVKQTNVRKPTDTKRASSGSSCTAMTPPLDNINLTPPLLDASITNPTPLSTSTYGKEGVKTPTSNVTGRQTKLMESSPDMCKETIQELEDLLQCDSEPTINTSSQYIAHEKSIKSAPDCKKWEFLELYITYAEQAMGQLQDEIYRLKNEKANNQAISKTPMNENPEIQNTNTNVKPPSPSNKNTKPDRPTCVPKRKAMLISDSMGLGIAGEINSSSNINCYASVNPGATVDRLSDQINSIIGNDQPDIVCLMAGTNNVGNGEKPQNVLNKIKGFVATVQKKCPAAQVVVAGLFHREDKPNLNKSIDVINSVLSRQRSRITFVNPNNGHNVDILKRDRLHMNAKGCKMMAQNIFNAIVEEHTSFHNGHMEIPREPLTLSPVIQQINVVTGLKASRRPLHLNTWW